MTLYPHKLVCVGGLYSEIECLEKLVGERGFELEVFWRRSADAIMAYHRRWTKGAGSRRVSIAKKMARKIHARQLVLGAGGRTRLRHPPQLVMSRFNPADSCGCAMGARFLAVGLAISSLWYGRTSGLSIGAILLRIMLWSFLAACLGKIVGIILFSLRRHRVQLRTARS